MSGKVVLHGQEGITKIGELIKDIHICMLTTAASDGSFDSRPMATQETGFDGTVWFLTRSESGMVSEMKSDSHVTLNYAEPAKATYVVVKGRATTTSNDRDMIHKLWNPMYKAWFPDGEEDASITLLRVDVTEAEYWEASSSKLIRGAKYLAAAVTGGKVDVGETGKITV